MRPHKLVMYRMFRCIDRDEWESKSLSPRRVHRSITMDIGEGGVAENAKAGPTLRLSCFRRNIVWFLVGSGAIGCLVRHISPTAPLVGGNA